MVTETQSRICTGNCWSYATPEETYTAKISALRHRDLDWYYETLTPETAVEDKDLLQKAGIDPKKKFDLVKENAEMFILENRPYKSGRLLIGMSRASDGIVTRGIVTLVERNGQWKITSEFGYDPALDQYDSLVLPSQLATPFSFRLYPEKLDLDWYNKAKGPQVAHEEIVCVLQGIKDPKGNLLPVTEIDSTTSLYLNDLVPHTPWSSSKNKPVDVLVVASPNDYKPGEFKSLNSWWKKANIPYSPENPVMLIKFNQHQAMQTLANPTSGKEYELSITGRLKDNNPFKCSARIRL